MNEEVEKLRRKLQDLEEQHTTGFVNDAQYAEFRALLEKRLVEAVMTSPMPLDALPPAPPAPPAEPPQTATTRPRRLLLGVGLAAVAGATGVGVWWATRRGAPALPASPQPLPPPPEPGRPPEPQAAELLPTPPHTPLAADEGAVRPSPADTGVVAPQPAEARVTAPASPDARSVAPAPPAAAGQAIEGTVSLSPTLASQAAPNDTVFVYARAVGGPPMPLAVIRAQVRDLPLRFRFDDSMALWTSAKLSSFPSVVIAARISRRGDASPQPGDLQGQSAPVAVGRTDVQVVIDGRTP